MPLSDSLDLAIYEVIRGNLEEFQGGRSLTPTIAYDNIRAILEKQGFRRLTNKHLEEPLGRIGRVCIERTPALPPLSALAVRLNKRGNLKRQIPGEGYFAVAHPGVCDEAEQLALWELDLERAREAGYPEALDL